MVREKYFEYNENLIEEGKPFKFCRESNEYDDVIVMSNNLPYWEI